MAGGISWKEFEAIVARLEKAFSKGSGTVTTDERIKGKMSGRSRQIDVCLRGDIGGENILIIVECKKWNRKADVKAVEAFAGVRKDVGAHIGIMVSTVGFSKAAHSTAGHESISLYRYADTQTSGWPNGLETSVLLEIWELTPTAAYFVLKDGQHENIQTDEGLDFFDAKDRTKASVPLATVVRQIWESFCPADKREWNWLFECACTTPDRPEIEKLGIGASSKFIRAIRHGSLHFQGLVDEKAGLAKVQGWKMVFDGKLTLWPQGKPLPKSQTYSTVMSSVFVRTQTLKSDTLQQLIYSGILELSVAGKNVMKLPIGTTPGLNLKAIRPKPFRPSG